MIASAFGRPTGSTDAPGPLDLADVEARTRAAFDFLWLDVVEPTAADLALLARLFGLHQLALEDVARQHQRPKIDEYSDHYFLVLYDVATRPTGVTISRGPTTIELQMFWGRDFFVTLRAEPCPIVDDIVSRLQQGNLRPVLANASASHRLVVADLAYLLIDAVVDGYFPFLDVMAERSEEIEEQMFATQVPRSMLEDIFSMKKQLIQARKVVAPSRDVLNVLLRHDLGLFDSEYVPYFQDVYDHTVRVIDSLDTYRDLSSSAIDIYLSLVSNNVNQTVKRMTALTAIFMVQALIAGIYGMNFENMPELRWTYGYPWALGLMASIGLTMVLVFRRMKWL
ncbi:MAG: magnesium/cobalt transporter CorA [Chloroflexi bacterium]|nr:magnesium/cobalt transporter CorA [Chloroflexota bacterium]